MNATPGRKNFTNGNLASLSDPLEGDKLSIGSGFTAQSFRAKDVGEMMDPLVMVDHYVMTEPTFGAHPHAGMSAVTLLLEDSEGLFHNKDSLGNDFELRPGDLYWLAAGSGAIHDEYPRANARTHGFQLFVNVSQKERFEAPISRLVRSEDMPVIETAEYRVKVAMGASNGVRAAASPSTPLTVLVGWIEPGGTFVHGAAANRGIWTQAIKGSSGVVVGEFSTSLAPGQAVAATTSGSESINITNRSSEAVHFALFDGPRINEAYVQDGPFVMGTEKQIAEIKAAYEANEFGSISGNL